MTDRERFWLNACATKKDDFVITVGSDCVFVTDIKNGDCVFEFENYGWMFALDLLLHMGCNAEKALRFIGETPTVDIVELPCKVGGIVYRIAEGNYHSDYKPFIKPMTVTEISWKKTRSDKDLGFAIIADGIRYRFSSIGKSVFLTLEDAEEYAVKTKAKEGRSHDAG